MAGRLLTKLQNGCPRGQSSCSSRNCLTALAPGGNSLAALTPGGNRLAALAPRGSCLAALALGVTLAPKGSRLAALISRCKSCKLVAPGARAIR